MDNKSIRGQVGLAVVVLAVVAWQTFQYSRIMAVNSAANTSGKPTDKQTEPIHLSRQAVAAHATPNDCWVIIEGSVYDVTLYLALHPGGTARISQYCGADGTAGFMSKGGKGLHSAIARAILGRLKMGTLGETVSAQAVQTTQSSISSAITNGTIPKGGNDD